MADTETPMEIICGSDTAYAPHLAVMLTSLVASNPGQNMRCHVLSDGITDVLRARIAACCPAVELVWHGADNHPVLQFSPLLQISRATYLRLMMLEVLSPKLNRILYLDIDMVINGDLLPLWNTDLGGKACAAVVDPGVDADKFASKYNLPGPARYFNAGMILIDLDKLRSKPFMAKAVEVLTNAKTPLEYADQDALNIALWNEWLPVDPAYNFQRKFLYDGCSAWKALTPVRREPVIIHFTERYKPWQKSEWHPYAWLYLRNLMRTPFRNEVLKDGAIGIIDIGKSWLRYVIKRPAIFRC